MASLAGFCRAIELPAAVKPAATAMVASLILALPAAAEPGKIFDFNLTLPIMIAELLALVVRFYFLNGRGSRTVATWIGLASCGMQCLCNLHVTCGACWEVGHLDPEFMRMLGFFRISPLHCLPTWRWTEQTEDYSHCGQHRLVCGNLGSCAATPLQVFLNLTWFTPLGNILEERDSSLRGMLRKARENVLQIEQSDVSCSPPHSLPPAHTCIDRPLIILSSEQRYCPLSRVNGFKCTVNS